MLLNIDNNAKTVKGQKEGYLTGVLYLAPSKTSGIEVCAHSTIGCRKACLNTAGRGAMNVVQLARKRKTVQLFNEREGFISLLKRDISKLLVKASKRGLTPAVRLNGTSDLPWWKPEFGEVPQSFPEVQFYDYTKNRYSLITAIPENYHITFSETEKNVKAAKWALDLGFNVATVFRELPDTHLGHPVINGDENDLRFLDPEGVIVGLKAKGRAKRDHVGFVK